VSDVVVTGAGGFVGRHLVAMLRADGVDVAGWIRADVDLCDPQAVAAAVRRERPRVLFHLASGAVAPERQTPNCIATEVAITAAIVAALPPGTILVQAGSMAEYGHAGRLTETDSAEPTSVYGRAKLAASHYALEHGAATGIAVTVARIFGVYGAGEMAGRLTSTLIEQLRNGQPVALSDGLQKRDFIHVSDVCRTLVKLAALTPEPVGRVVNVGTGQAITVRLACERIADALMADRRLLQFGAVPRRATDQCVLEANVDRLTALLGAAPPQRFLVHDDAALRALIGA